MTNTLVIRAAEPTDAAAIAALGRSSFIAAFGHLYSAENLHAFLDEAHTTEAVAGQIADAAMLCVIAEDDGGPAGFCKLRRPSSFLGQGQGLRPVELKQLYTDPDRTGAGVGAALMDRALDWAREHQADSVQLSVWSGNDRAQRFYARYGFAKVADIHFWVGQHRDEEFLFEKLL